MWQREARHSRIRSAGVFRRDGKSVDGRWCGKALVPVIRIAQLLKPGAPFAGIDVAPSRAGSERVQVLMKKQLAQGIWRVVLVDQGAAGVDGADGLIEPRDERIGDALLPVSDGVARWRGRRLGCETISIGRPGDDGAERENEGRAVAAAPGRQRGSALRLGPPWRCHS
jgi:hypothetical protein